MFDINNLKDGPRVFLPFLFSVKCREVLFSTSMFIFTAHMVSISTSRAFKRLFKSFTFNLLNRDNLSLEIKQISLEWRVRELEMIKMNSQTQGESQQTK